MAVVSSEIATAILELRSAALTLIAVVLKTTDLEVLATELEQRASVMPGLFEDEPVAIDLSRVRDADEPIDFPNCWRCCAATACCRWRRAAAAPSRWPRRSPPAWSKRPKARGRARDSRRWRRRC